MARVLLLTPTGAPGGAERVLTGLARRLPSLGHDVGAVSLEDGPAVQWLEGAGCPVQVIEAGRLRQVVRAARTVRRLVEVIRSGAFDVVVANQAKGHLYGGTAARRAGVPAVYWNHGIPERDRLNRLAARVPAATVVCTTDGAAEAQRRLTPEAEIRTIRPGVDVAAVSARRGSGTAVREHLGWNDAPLVGIVGRLQPWKGQRVFLDAAAVLADRVPEARFLVVGGAVLAWEGDEQADLEAHAGTLGLDDRVRFVGHQDDVYPWIDALDVVVHASVVAEPFGLVVVEAMVLGKPVVATAAGGPLEIVEDGVSGLLVPPDDSEALADAVARVLGDSTLGASLSAAAVRRAKTFTEDRMAEEFSALLSELVPGS